MTNPGFSTCDSGEDDRGHALPALVVHVLIHTPFTAREREGVRGERQGSSRCVLLAHRCAFRVIFVVVAERLQPTRVSSRVHWRRRPVGHAERGGLE